MIRRLVLAGFAAFALTGTAAAQTPPGKLKVVASFSILEDAARVVGGERVSVEALVGRGGDAHAYNPTPADARKLKEASVILANGLGFEGWLERLVKASGSKAALAIASKGVKARKADDDHGHSHGANNDPHAWQSVANYKIYIANVRDALSAADPAGASAYQANATAYLARLDALDKEVREAVARIPAERRKIITTHDAFGYFHDAYGLDFIAPQGVSTETEASAKDVARIITQVKKQKIPAVFLENVSDQRLLRRIADETGAKIGGTLYSDALTGAAPTYIDMMQHNIKTLSAALMS